jgi:hypothetical protein
MPDRNTQTGHGIQTHSPGQTSTGQRDEHETKPRFHRTRPETHQNLIHPDKEQQTKNNRRLMTTDVAGRFSLKNTPPRSRDLSARYSFASSQWGLRSQRSWTLNHPKTDAVLEPSLRGISSGESFPDGRFATISADADREGDREANRDDDRCAIEPYAPSGG